jgi:YesN/AraC family two-component response regulator
MTVRTLVVDDSSVARKVLKIRLKQMGFEVVGEAVDAYEGLAMVRRLQPRLVTLDLFMPVVGGVDSKVLFRMIREENPEIGIVVISGQPKVRPGKG